MNSLLEHEEMSQSWNISEKLLKRMPAFGKAKSHNWVEADNAFGDFDAIKVFQDDLYNQTVSDWWCVHYTEIYIPLQTF